MEYQAHWVPKRGHRPDEYEDAFAADAAAGRFAVADGATESGFAASWAQLLVRHFAQADCDPTQWTAWLPPAQAQWSADLDGRPLPWYAEAKLRQGAFATFLGVTVAAVADQACRWHAVAVGDSCLFHTRGPALLGAFPVKRSSEFGSSPHLVGSRTPPDEVCQTRAVDRRGDAQPRDRLWLMTDALAEWFLKEHEAGRTPWRELRLLLQQSEDPNRFALWIDRLRDGRRIRNDDVTLVVVRL